MKKKLINENTDIEISEDGNVVTFINIGEDGSIYKNTFYVKDKVENETDNNENSKEWFMPKKKIIQEAEEWFKKNMPDKEILGGEFESLHASGQENYAIYTAYDDLIIQENNYKDEDESKRHETEYHAHGDE